MLRNLPYFSFFFRLRLFLILSFRFLHRQIRYFPRSSLRSFPCPPLLFCLCLVRIFDFHLFGFRIAPSRILKFSRSALLSFSWPSFLFTFFAFLPLPLLHNLFIPPINNFNIFRRNRPTQTLH